MRNRSVVDEGNEIRRASELIRLGARLQLLESETKLSRERLLRLYKEMVGKSPPKGMLPFSTDWFVTWLPNIHASLFMGIYQHLIQSSALEEIDGELYLACEYVPGQTLRTLIQTGPLPLTQVVEIATQLAHALAAAHAQGVVHCDIKTENILISEGT